MLRTGHLPDARPVRDNEVCPAARSILLLQEIDTFHQQYPAEPFTWIENTPRLTFSEGVQMLRDAGCPGVPEDVSEFDLNTEQERTLGKLVKAKYGTDFYMLIQYPLAVRPFYTMPDPHDKVRHTGCSLVIHTRCESIDVSSSGLVCNQRYLLRMSESRRQTAAAVSGRAQPRLRSVLAVQDVCVPGSIHSSRHLSMLQNGCAS